MNTRWLRNGAYLGAVASLLMVGNSGTGSITAQASSGATTGIVAGRITHHTRLARHLVANKGTIKISESSLYEPPAGGSNEPHVSCPFWIQGYLMDASTGTITVTVQNPTTGTQVAGQTILTQSWSADNTGFFNTGPYGTQSGFLSGGHYKVRSSDTRNPKTKVFWVDNCAAPPTSTPTATETSTSVPTSTPTLVPPTATATSRPTATPTGVATSTPTSVPTSTNTPTLVPTQAAVVVPTNTPVPPTATNTPVLGGAARPTARPTPPCPPAKVRTVIHNIVHTRIVTRTRTVVRTVVRTRVVVHTRTVVHNIVHRVVVIRRVIVIQRVVATPTPMPPNPCASVTPTAGGGCGLG